MSNPTAPSPPADLAEAIEHHREGRLEAALRSYGRVLEANPSEPTALNFLGMLHVQFGDQKLGAQLIKRATDVAPGYAGAHCNLGTALVELGEMDDARASYENAVSVDATHAEAHNNLGALLRCTGDIHGAIAHLILATEIQPDWATAQVNLGNAFAHSGNQAKAASAFERAIEANPQLNDAYRQLGLALYGSGKLDQAAEVFRKLLTLDPENPVGVHMLAAVTGEGTPERCDQAYVRNTFDDFAASFDQKLAHLDYAGPALVMDAAATQLAKPDGGLRCLDLGAGTGLCGLLVKPYARELIGVDLSPEMLKKASRRELYDELVVADLCEYLGGDVGEFDLMLSADVLIYFGALDELLAGVARRLKPGGCFTFTVEAWPEEELPGYVLGPSGRYAHGRSYVERQVAAAGLRLASIEEASLRKELDAGVSGLIVVAQKPVAES